MNRSVLIVIVDFLLVSLVAFSRFDDEDLTRSRGGQPVAAASAAGQKDVVDVLKVSLDTERQSREQLNEQLRQAQVQLQTRERVLADREQLIREAEQLLQQKADESARLERERVALEQQFANTRSDVASLQKELGAVRSEATQSKQQLESVQSDLKAREQEEALLKRKLTQLDQARQAAEAEKLRLATQLEVAETEKRLFHQQLDSAKGEVQVVRQEKAQLQQHASKLTEHATKLAEGVSTLAEKSGELTKEIRDNRPLAPNTVFSDFVASRIRADFRAVRSGLFGREINREKESKTVLVRHENQIYAIYHVNDTPLTFSFPGMDWDWLIGNLRRGTAVARVERISFLAIDPRVVVVPVGEAKAKELGSKVYTIPKEPFKFQEAIIVGADEGYYGECKFQIEPENPQYVRMQRERFSWVMGKFAPSSGDLVFTKTGDLLGLMVNKEYCLLLNEFAPAYHIQTGIGIGDQQTGLILSQLYSQVARMPVKLQ